MAEGRLQRTVQRLTRRSDLLLAVLVVAIIFMMILPMPTPLVDTLIALNIGGAVVLLMVAIYIRSPVAFSAFPSVLLLTTLFRLALSITTTRLILLQADAGAIVYTFGNFVVAGSLVVGLVVFLIITLVQFIVITKGAERVAEVGARFSLDGMPGKQMSIDSDLRAGVITLEQARHRRALLEQESQLYGAMDGAMKFVKGDAIAGLLIIIVNLLGGLSIGVFQQGLSTADAMHLYSILTVGDGLVAQIPALFIAIAAGIIVTRVTSDESDNLGADIGNQIFAQPNALLIGGAILVGFALVPGFPAVIFVLLGLATAGLGLVLLGLQRRRREQQLEEVQEDGAPGGDGEAAPSPRPARPALPSPLVLSLPRRREADVVTPQLNAALGRVRRALFQYLGVPFPGLHLRFDEEREDDGYTLFLHDVPVANGSLGAPGRRLAATTADQLEVLGVPFERGEPFLPGLETLWVAAEAAPRLAEAGIDSLGPADILAHHLAHLLRDHADQFVGIQETHRLLKRYEDGYAELVKEALRAVPLPRMAEVLRQLVAEEVSLRDLRGILEALVRWGPQVEDPAQLTEHVRTHLKRHISYRFSSRHNILPAFLLDPNTEDLLRQSLRQTPSGSHLALDPQLTRQFFATLREAFGRHSSGERPPALLTALDLRRHLRQLLAGEFRHLPVLSYQELTPEITVQPLGRVGIPAMPGGGAA